MKKKIFALTLAFIFVFSIIPFNSSAEQLSYAMSNLSEEAKMIKSGILGKEIRFSATDFKQALGVRNFKTVTILSLPNAEDGTLKYANVSVTEGQKISRSNLYLLKFVPASEEVTESSFTFSCDKCAGGASIVCELKLLDKINYEPTLQKTSNDEQNVSTQKNVSLFGRLSAVDPEGDELSFFVVKPTKNGTLTFTDAKYGDFKYTPKANFTGKDSFTYVVRDEYGNYSKTATVNIDVSKRRTEIVYKDMDDNSAYNAALTLAEKSIMLGEISGDGMYFYPEEKVSRGDFTVMVMKVAGIKVGTALENTSFDDNDKIPESIRTYISYAQRMRYVNGKFDGTGLYFDADAPITRAEAAVVINNILGATVPTSKPVFSDSDDIPTWAEGSVYALYTIGIMERTDRDVIGAREDVTRAQAAQMIYAMLNIK